MIDVTEAGFHNKSIRAEAALPDSSTIATIEAMKQSDALQGGGEAHIPALLRAAAQDIRDFTRSGDLQKLRADCLDALHDVPLSQSATRQLDNWLYEQSIDALQGGATNTEDYRAVQALVFLSQSFATKTQIGQKAERVIADFEANARGGSKKQQDRVSAIQTYCATVGVQLELKTFQASGAGVARIAPSVAQTGRTHKAHELAVALAQHKTSRRVAGVAAAAALAVGLPVSNAVAAELTVEPATHDEQQATIVVDETTKADSTAQSITILKETPEGPKDVQIDEGANNPSQYSAPLTLERQPTNQDDAVTSVTVSTPQKDVASESIVPITLIPLQQLQDSGGDVTDRVSGAEDVVIAEPATIDSTSNAPITEIAITPSVSNMAESANVEAIENTQDSMPDTDVNPKEGETSGETIDRVVQGGDTDNATYVILKTYGADPENIGNTSPPNAKLDVWVKDNTDTLIGAVINAEHDAEYAQNASRAVAFLDAIQKDPTILEDKEVQDYINSLSDTGDVYHDALFKEHMITAAETLVSEELGKGKGLDEDTVKALTTLYAYIDLATVSDADQAARIDEIKAEEERKREEERQRQEAEQRKQQQAGYSDKAIAAGEATSDQYDSEIDKLIKGFNLEPAKEQFMRDMVAEIESMDPANLPVNVEIMFAQGIVESGWGQSELAAKYHNLFGIKAGSSWSGNTVMLPTREVYDGEDVIVDAKWPVFGNYAESLDYYANTLIGGLDRYNHATEVKDDPDAYLQAIKDAGYATDPEYVNIVSSVANKYTDDIVAKILNKPVAVQQAMDTVKAQEEKAAQEAAAKKEAEKKAEEEKRKQQEQSGDIRAQLEPAKPIMDALKDKYNDVSGKLSDSELATTPGLYNNGEPVNIKLNRAAMKGYKALAEAFRKEFGYDIQLTDWYRTYDTQVRLKKEKGRWAAEPGTSNHGWGFAIDFASNINAEGSKEHEWMEKNSYKYGWINPAWAHRNGDKPEAWHWEYVGPDAAQWMSEDD